MTDASSRTVRRPMLADRDTPLLYNQWYIAAYAREVTRTPMDRWLLGESVLLYRKNDGTAVAMQNRCPHRAFPLSKGRLEDDNVVCGYHGFKFNSGGKCVQVPSQKKTPNVLDIPAYPLVESGPLLWIWMGAPELADPARIPDHSFLCAPDNNHVLGYFHVKSNYVPLHENVLDLTHFHFLHGNDVGSLSFIEAPPQCTVKDGAVHVLRVDRDTAPPPHYARMAGITGHRADRISEAVCPSPAISWARATIVDREPQPGARTDYHFWVVHGLTPASQHETHYFWANARDCSLNDKEIDAWLIERSGKVLSEDVEAVQWCNEVWRGTAPERYGEMNVAADNPGVQVRRMIAQLAALEHAPQAQVPQTSASDIHAPQ